jgi:hypothetical protein
MKESYHRRSGASGIARLRVSAFAEASNIRVVSILFMRDLPRIERRDPVSGLQSAVSIGRLNRCGLKNETPDR